MAGYRDMPVELVLVRHGESEGNVVQKYPELEHHVEGRSRFDFRLTARGRRQAKRAGAWMRANRLMGFDGYFTSDQPRAQETAALLGFTDAKWHEDTDLREQHISGGSDQETSEDTIELTAARSIAPENFLTSLREKYSGRRVIAVSHATIIRSLIDRIERPTYEDRSTLFDKKLMRIKNCQIVWYTRRDPYRAGVNTLASLSWKRVVVPYVTKAGDPHADTDWQELKRPHFDNNALIKRAGRVGPLHISEEDIERARHYEEDDSELDPFIRLMLRPSAS